MRALAQFIMQGRLQASVIAVLGIPVISQAAAALVLLRLGVGASVLVIIASIAPALLMVASAKEQIIALMAAMTLASIISVMLGAWALRATRSWNSALVMAVASSMVSVLVIYWVTPSSVSLLTAEIIKAAQSLADQSGVESVSLDNVTDSYSLGVMASVNLMGVIPCLLLARWWQAQLYNPGGFREEVHALRLSPGVALACIAAVGFCLATGKANQSWLLLFLLPLYVSAIGLVHWLVSAKRVGSQWLFVFYVLFLFVAPVRSFVAVLAIADSFLNLRGRIAPRSQDNSD